LYVEHPLDGSSRGRSSRRSGGRSSNHAAVYGCRAVASCTNNTVDVASIVVASVHSVARIPGLGVKRTVSAERNAVLGQDVAGEEVARLVLAVGIDEVVLVELGLGLAGGGAKGRIIGTVVEEAHSVVGIVLFAVLLDIWCVDGGWQVCGGLEVLNNWRVLAGRVKLGVA
jgi:hypothetical protein